MTVVLYKLRITVTPYLYEYILHETLCGDVYMLKKLLFSHNASMTAYCVLQVKVRVYWYTANKPKGSDWGKIQYIGQFVDPITRAYSQKAWQAFRGIEKGHFSSELCPLPLVNFPIPTPHCCWLTCALLHIQFKCSAGNEYNSLNWIELRRSLAAQREQKPQTCWLSISNELHWTIQDCQKKWHTLECSSSTLNHSL